MNKKNRKSLLRSAREIMAWANHLDMYGTLPLKQMQELKDHADQVSYHASQNLISRTSKKKDA